MHDGQNLFDPELSYSGVAWDMDETIKRLTARGEIPPIMVVGIDNSGEKRYDEYSPWRMKNLDQFKRDIQGEQGGQGFAYIQDLVEELKPYIEREYRGLPDFCHNALGGSSMGGLITLAAGALYPQTFGKLLAMSTASWFCEREFLTFLKDHPPGRDTRIYLDVGTQETSDHNNSEFPQIYLENSRNIYHQLIEAGHPQENMNFRIDQGGYHSETLWAKRLPGALKWLYQ